MIQIGPKELETKSCDTLESGEPRGGWDAYAMEPKYDGFRIVSHVTAAGEVEMYTRSMKRNETKLPYVCEELLSMCPPNTVLDGEIVALQWDDGEVNNDFEHVQSVMLSKPDRAVRVANEVRPLDYMVFDLTFHGGADLRSDSYMDRRTALQLLFSGELERVFLSPFLRASMEQHEEFYSMGFEGTVIKHRDSTYENGARGKGWYKLKPQRSVDAIVMGYTEGDGKYSGQIGSIIFGQPDEHGRIVKRGQCSGMTDAVRLDISRNRDSYMHSVIEFAHMGTYKNSHMFRHPQFKRFRPDKPVKEVTWHDR